MSDSMKEADEIDDGDLDKLVNSPIGEPCIYGGCRYGEMAPFFQAALSWCRVTDREIKKKGSVTQTDFKIVTDDLMKEYHKIYESKKEDNDASA